MTSNSENAPFVGTERLIRGDHFHGQPCPTDPPSYQYSWLFPRFGWDSQYLPHLRQPLVTDSGRQGERQRKLQDPRIRRGSWLADQTPASRSREGSAPSSPGTPRTDGPWKSLHMAPKEYS